MSIPNAAWTSVPIVTAFDAPESDPYAKLRQRIWGGVAIGNGSQGRTARYWIVDYVGGLVRLAPEGQAVQWTLPVAGVLTVSAGFDSNMAPAVAYQTVAGAHLYYFNIVGNDFETLTVAGAASSRIALDDPRTFNAEGSDLIWLYTLNSNLYWREQRDRYQTQQLVGVSGEKKIRRAGRVRGGRFMVETRIGT